MNRFRALLPTSLLLLCLLATHAQSQTDKTLDGFWGMRFGASKAECRKTILSKAGASIDEKLSDEGSLAIKGAKFGGRDNHAILLLFVNDKLHTAKVLLSSPLEARTQSLFDEVKADVDEAYRPADRYFRIFRSPYYDGDGYEMQAVKLGKGDISAFWQFGQGNDGKIISLTINENLWIILSYQDSRLAAEAALKAKDKNLKDYKD